MHYVHFTWQMSNRILNSYYPAEADAAVEDALKQNREHLGSAWEGSKVKISMLGVGVAPHSPQSIQEATSDEVEAQLPPDFDSRIIANPSLGNLSFQGAHSGGASHSRIIFNPAMRESDLNMVSL